MLRVLVVLAAVGAASGLTSCSGTPEQALMGIGDGVHDLFVGHTNAKEETLRLPTTGVLSVDAVTFAGDVSVIGNPAAKETTVTVLREGTHGFLRQTESKESLSSIQATAEVTPGSLGPILVVRATTADPEDHFQRAHLVIEGRDLDGVRVRTARGSVLLRDVTGTIDVESSGGGVRIMSKRPLIEPVVVLNSEGSIDYRVNGLSTGNFDMQTIGGEIRVRSIDGGWLFGRIDPARPDRATATLGDAPANSVVLRTTEGDIRIAIVPDPTAVGAIIVDP
jgi:hypothetical protein